MGGAECANANCHRTVVRASQQKLATVEDISSAWTIRQDRWMHTDLWGEDKYPIDSVGTGVLKPVKRTGGGGAPGRRPKSTAW